MRRCLHSLLVGVLTFSLAIDAARACGHLRRSRCCPPPCSAPVMLEPAVLPWDGCGSVEFVGACPVTVHDLGCVPVGVIVGGCEEIGCGTPLDCCGSQAVAALAPLVAPPAVPAGESVVARSPSPEQAPPQPTPAVASLPKLEPVEQAAATEPAVPATIEPEPESAPPSAAAPDAAEAATAPRDDVMEGETVEKQEIDVPEPAPTAEEPAVLPAEDEPPVEPAPRRRNIFDEADAATETTERRDEVAPEDLPVDEPAAVPADEPVEAMGADAEAAAEEPAAGGTAPVVPLPEEPAADDVVDPDPAVEPAAQPQSDSDAAAEPLRRWIDDTAASVITGRLVEIHGEAVEIVKVDGRRVTVPTAHLSAFDRDYVAEAGQRIVASRAAAPQQHDTAGL